MNPELKEKIAVKTRTCEEAVHHADLSTLNTLLQKCYPRSPKRKQTALDRYFSLAAQMNNHDAMHILIAYGACATEGFRKCALTLEIDPLEECVSKGYVSLEQVQQTVQEIQKMKHGNVSPPIGYNLYLRKKEKTLQLLGKYPTLRMRGEYHRTNVTVSLQHRELGNKRRKICLQNSLLQ